MGYVHNPPPVGGGEGWLDVPGDIVFDGMGHEIISFQENVPFLRQDGTMSGTCIWTAVLMKSIDTRRCGPKPETVAKYAEAIRIYETTAEDLKSIAARLGLTYNSLSSFIRRSSPMSPARHKEHLLSGDYGVENEV